MTVGPGSLVWERFGHNGIRIRDRSQGIDLTYHWGLFSFQSLHFWPRFLKGHMTYSIGSERTQRFLQFNVESDREIHLQKLNLTFEQMNALFQRLIENDTDGNRSYRYDYYLDNCSTRARDAIDVVVGGRIAKATQETETHQSFRSHTRRLLQGMLLPYLGIQLSLGHSADEKISVWEEMFTPMALRRHLNEIALADGSPLVLSDKLIFNSSSMIEPKEAPSFLFTYLSVAVSIGLLMVILAYLTAAGKKSARALLALIGILWSFLSGLAGIAFLLIWFFTEHRFGHWNENLLQYNPLSWVMAVFFFALLVRGQVPRKATAVLHLILGCSVLGFFLQAVPAFDQVNGEAIALALPLHLGMVWAMRIIGQSSRKSVPLKKRH
ncbi:MAG: DUF4105 domain-containing protein [Nitrospiria bacterium]